MDTNTAKQPTEQKKQELEEEVEQFKQDKTTLPNQAREIMGSSAFEQADKLAQKPQNNDEPLSFEKSFDTNSQAKADEYNDIGLQSQTPQEQSNYTIIPPDVSEGVKYQKYRNTGVDYFDRKGNLSLLDAYLAKQLGLNVSYNFHKIDMKVDNRTKNVNLTQLYNDVRKLQAQHNQGVGLLSSAFLKKTGGVTEAMQTAIAKTAGGAFFNVDADDLALNEAIINLHTDMTRIGSNTSGEKSYERSANLLKNVTSTPNRTLDVMILPMQKNHYQMIANLRQARAIGADPRFVADLENIVKEQEKELNILKSMQGKDLSTQRQGALSLFAQNNRKSI